MAPKRGHETTKQWLDLPLPERNSRILALIDRELEIAKMISKPLSISLDESSKTALATSLANQRKIIRQGDLQAKKSRKPKVKKKRKKKDPVQKTIDSLEHHLRARLKLTTPRYPDYDLLDPEEFVPIPNNWYSRIFQNKRKAESKKGLTKTRTSKMSKTGGVSGALPPMPRMRQPQQPARRPPPQPQPTRHPPPHAAKRKPPQPPVQTPIRGNQRANGKPKQSLRPPLRLPPLAQRPIPPDQEKQIMRRARELLQAPPLRSFSMGRLSPLVPPPQHKSKSEPNCSLSDVATFRAPPPNAALRNVQTRCVAQLDANQMSINTRSKQAPNATPKATAGLREPTVRSLVVQAEGTGAGPAMEPKARLAVRPTVGYGAGPAVRLGAGQAVRPSEEPGAGPNMETLAGTAVRPTAGHGAGLTVRHGARQAVRPSEEPGAGSNMETLAGTAVRPTVGHGVGPAVRHGAEQAVRPSVEPGAGQTMEPEAGPTMRHKAESYKGPAVKAFMISTARHTVESKAGPAEEPSVRPVEGQAVSCSVRNWKGLSVGPSIKNSEGPPLGPSVRNSVDPIEEPIIHAIRSADPRSEQNLFLDQLPSRNASAPNINMLSAKIENNDDENSGKVKIFPSHYNILTHNISSPNLNVNSALKGPTVGHMEMCGASFLSSNAPIDDVCELIMPSRNHSAPDVNIYSYQRKADCDMTDNSSDKCHNLDICSVDLPHRNISTPNIHLCSTINETVTKPYLKMKNLRESTVPSRTSKKPDLSSCSTSVLDGFSSNQEQNYEFLPQAEHIDYAFDLSKTYVTQDPGERLPVRVMSIPNFASQCFYIDSDGSSNAPDYSHKVFKSKIPVLPHIKRTAYEKLDKRTLSRVHHSSSIPILSKRPCFNEGRCDLPKHVRNSNNVSEEGKNICERDLEGSSLFSTKRSEHFNNPSSDQSEIERNNKRVHRK